jgi:hypothetical protein
MRPTRRRRELRRARYTLQKLSQTSHVRSSTITGAILRKANSRAILTGGNILLRCDRAFVPPPHFNEAKVNSILVHRYHFDRLEAPSSNVSITIPHFAGENIDRVVRKDSSSLENQIIDRVPQRGSRGLQTNCILQSRVNTRRSLRIRRTDDRLDMTGRSQNSRENSDRINERSGEKNGTNSPGAISGDGNDDSDGSHNSDDSEDDSSTSGNNGAIFDYVGDGSGEVDVLDFGDMSQVCEYCHALYFLRERKPGTRIYSKCCNGGRIVLEAPHDTPPLIKSFFLGENPRWKHILDSQVIRLNNAISLAAIQYTSVRLSGPGVPTIVVDGQINDSLPL